MKAVCDKYGALLILDGKRSILHHCFVLILAAEVMSGMGRCGALHVWEQEGVVPDIQTMGKGLGGGYASIAAVLLGHRVVDNLTDGTG